MQNITEIGTLKFGLQRWHTNITSLFFADYGTLFIFLESSIENAEIVVWQIVETGRECGQEINKPKSNIIIFDMKDKPQEIKVKDKTRYLGIIINDAKKNLFKVHKENMMVKTDRMANLTYSVIARCFSWLKIGKIYWNSIALPYVLYGANIIDFTKEELRNC